MSEFNSVSLSDAFDFDFGSSPEQSPHEQNTFSDLDFVGKPYILENNDFLHYQDPLKHAYKHQFQPLELNLDNTHLVKPHHVNGYFRSDGTYVEGFYRDGDGDSSINRPLEAGGGYLRSDPDGDPFNNL